MTNLVGLPGNVIELMRSGAVANYATVSSAGIPIDTPVLCFPADDLSSFGLATGLSYPAKAERARRNPKVGLLLRGGPDEPVISVAGMAAVRDADLQCNAERYIAEACYTMPHNPDWALARRAVWYWSRIIVEIAPARIAWWDSPAAMDGPPKNWRAPEGATFPPSDPAPPGRCSMPAKWQEMPWPELAGQALARSVPGQLTLLDAEGYPRPVVTSSISAIPAGFAIGLPRGISWPLAGKACLTFGGIETFLGEVSGSDGQAELQVERTLPIFPMTQDLTQLWEPTDDTRAQLMRRLEEETRRRGQPVPTIPLERPQPSPGYRRRMQRMGMTVPA